MIILLAGYVGRDLIVTQFLDKFLAVIALVGAQGHPILARELVPPVGSPLEWFITSGRLIDTTSHRQSPAEIYPRPFKLEAALP
jgi:hypothetical protein